MDRAYRIGRATELLVLAPFGVLVFGGILYACGLQVARRNFGAAVALALSVLGVGVLGRHILKGAVPAIGRSGQKDAHKEGQ